MAVWRTAWELHPTGTSSEIPLGRRGAHFVSDARANGEWSATTSRVDNRSHLMLPSQHERHLPRCFSFNAVIVKTP